MSRPVMKRKHVLRHILGDDTPPTPGQQIVKVLSTSGNNLHCVETQDGFYFLVSMPRKFRHNFFIKCGHFVIIEPIKEGGKVKGEIVRVLTPELIKSFKRDGVWPSAFDDEKKSDDEQENSSEDELFRNTNRRVFDSYDEEEEDSSSSESDDKEEDSNSSN